jgi:lysozyme
MSINLIDAAKYFRDYSHQKAAWEWLQSQLTSEQLAEFAKLYRDSQNWAAIAAQYIKRLEGLRLEAYLCPANVWTIGYGSTTDLQGKAIKKGDIISVAQAGNYFMKDLLNFELKLKQLQEWENFNSNQKASIASFTYNVGINGYINSTLRKTILSNSSETEIRKQFMRWNKIDGKEILGLTKRRAIESELFFKV